MVLTDNELGMIGNIANESKCKVIDLYNQKKTYDSIDGSHPNSQGMQTIAELVCNEMSDAEGKLILKGHNEKMHNTLESNSFEEEEDFVDIFITTILYDCVLKLTDVDSGKEIIIEEPRVDVGRDSSCSLRLQESKISRLHATFIYENNVWYIKDNHSKNGTSLNGIIIEPDKKYQLMEGDIIEFAHSGKFIFYRYENNNSEPDKKKTIKEIREEDLIGHIVGGKYSLQQVIGNGGCTKVFLATDNTNKKYAIKCASKDAVGFNPVVDAFLGEVDILKRLHHTNIRGVIEQIEGAVKKQPHFRI